VRDVQRLGLDAYNWYGVAQDRPRGSSVVTGSFVCGCGRTFGHSGDVTRHKKYCDGQPLDQNNQNLTVGVADVFIENVISLGTSITVPAELVSLVSSSDPGPCYCLQTGH